MTGVQKPVYRPEGVVCNGLLWGQAVLWLIGVQCCAMMVITKMASAERTTGYGPLLADGRFEGFLWAQFLGAFNDNVYKMIVSFTALRSRWIALPAAATALRRGFHAPFILFSGYAGQLADRYSKTRMLQITKSLEIVTMVMGIAALLAGSMNMLLVVLFLLATQATFSARRSTGSAENDWRSWISRAGEYWN